MKTIALIILSLITTPLAAETKILAFSGSLREDSYNKKLINEAAEMARQQGATVNIIDLKDFSMPFFDEDIEKAQGMPSNAKKLRAQMIASNGIIIATPEYNASLSAILKNALDWASRSEDGKPSRDAFKGKKFALMSASQGPGGGARALAHLKAVIENAGGEVVDMQTSIPTAQSAFNSQGKLENPAIKDKLKSEIELLLK
jgi:chromate reductase